MRYRTLAVGKIDEELRMNNQIDLALPNLYAEFLSRIDKAGELIIENTGNHLILKTRFARKKLHLPNRRVGT